MLVDYEEESSWAGIGNSSQIFFTDENDNNEDHHHQLSNGDGPPLNIILDHQSRSAPNPHNDFISLTQPALFPHHQSEQPSSVYNHHQHSFTPSYPQHQSIMLLQDSSDGDGGYMVVPKREEGVAARLGLNLGHRTYFSAHDDDFINRLYRRSRPGLYESSVGFEGTINPVRCQAEGCGFDLSNAKHYHRRHKVCEFHSKASSVRAGGLTQRFCQQCSRFHLLSEFDNGKRSCRKRLADHNKRRRKSQQHVNQQDHQRRPKPHHRENEQRSSSENNNNFQTGGSPPESATTHPSSSVIVAAISPSRVLIDRYQQMSYQELPSSSSSSLFYPN